MRYRAHNRGGMRIREESRAGYGMTVSWRDRDALISIGEILDSFEIESGMRDLTSKYSFENLTRRDRDKHSEKGGMAG